MASRALARILDDFPDVAIDKVEYLSNRAVARAAGVKTIPSLVYGEARLSGAVLTKGKIRSFLEAL